MNDAQVKLNCLEVFQKNFEKYIEAFVLYYGEDRREEIKEKFSNALPLAYLTPDGLTSVVRELFEEKSHELVQKVMSVNETTLEEEEIFRTGNYEYPINIPINAYLEFKKAYELGPEGRKRKAISVGYNNAKKYMKDLTINEFITMVEQKSILEKYNKYPTWLKNSIIFNTDLNGIEDKFNSQFEEIKDLITPVSGIERIEDFSYENTGIKKLNVLAETYEKTLEEYESFKSNNQSYIDEVEQNEDTESKIREKYFKELLVESSFLFNEEEQEKIKKYLSGEDYFLNTSIMRIIGNTLFDTSPIESFSKESDEILKGENEEENWRIEFIKRDRVNYFKAKGYVFGNNYEDYLNVEVIKNIWPTEEQIKRVRELKKTLIKKSKIEYYENTTVHKKLREIVDSKDFLVPDDGIGYDIYKNFTGKTFVSTNLTKENDKYKLSPIVCISFNNDMEELEHLIIHELNHLFELSFDSVVDNKARCICGWDIMEDEMSGETKDYISIEHDENEKRDYELFNEIINELIAQDIHNKMIENNIRILDEKGISKTNNITSYEKSLFLVRDFFNEFKEDIIKSRSNGNIKVIYNAVGKENFEELNSLFKIYFENFGGMKIYALQGKLEAKTDDETTRIYYELLDRKNEILEKMRAFKNAKKGENLSI